MIVALPIADRGDASILPFLFRFTLIPLGECIDWRIVADPIRSVQAFQQIPHRRVFRSIAQQNDCISFAKGFHETGCPAFGRSEEHTSDLQSLMRITYAVCCLYKKQTE